MYLKYPIIIITLLVITGILLGGYFGIPLKILYLCLAIAFTGMIFFYFLSYKKIESVLHHYFLLTFIISWISLGFLLQKRIDKQNFPSHYSHYLSQNHSNILFLEIDKKLSHTKNYNNYMAKVFYINQKKASGKVLVKQKAKKNLLKPGDRLSIMIDYNQIKNIQTSSNPYSFDYKKYMARKGLYHQLYLSSIASLKIQQDSYFNINRKAEEIRDYIKKLFTKNGLKGNEYKLASSLFLGERKLLDKKIIQDFQKAGTIHILAISGLHIGILLLFLNVIFGEIKNKFGKLPFLIITIGFLWGFAFITGFSPSVLRAVIMFSFIQVAYQLNRNANIYNTLFAAAFFMILFQPSIIYEVGFQLSFAAVLGIISFFPILSKPILHWRQPWKWIGELFFVSLSAQMGIFPISLYYFHQFPVFFLLANLLVIPLLFLILFMGFSLIILGSIGLNIAFLWKIFEMILKLLIKINASIAQIGYSLIPDIPFDKTKVFISFIILFSLYKLIKNHFKPIYIFIVFSLIIFLQGHTLFEKWKKKEVQQIFFLQQYNSPLMARSVGDEIHFYGDSTHISPYLLQSFKQHYNKIYLDTLPFYIEIQNLKILHIDSLGIWELNPPLRPDVISLSNSPKINLERLIMEIKPKEIIALGANYPSFVNRWKRTCEKFQIKFTDINQTGALVKNLKIDKIH